MAKDSYSCWIWKLGLICSLAIGVVINPTGVVSFGTFPENSVLAQIVPDSTLGAETSVINSNVNIKGIPSDQIEGGAIRGTNLFHSFEEFNVREGQGAYFISHEGIERILSRVTGNSDSQILGKLGVLGNADLFLINPNGIVFGINATLDLKGSFLATTANSFIFEDGTQFSATDTSAPPLLTVGIPVGLRIRESAGSIVNQSQAALTDSNGSIFGLGLEIQSGKTLALVGGNITLEGGSIAAPRGRIELGSVAGTEQVGLQKIDSGWALNYEGVQNFQDIELTPASTFISDPAFAIPLLSTFSNDGSGGGSIKVQGRRVTLANGSQIFGEGSNILVSASETLQVSGIASNGFFSAIASLSPLTGKEGSVLINTKKLIVQDGGRVTSDTSGIVAANVQLMTTKVPGGNLIINASEFVELKGNAESLTTGLFSKTGSFGDAGNIIINTPKLIIQDGASISAESTGLDSLGEPIATGAAGNININASKSIELNNGFISTATSGLGGKAGNLTIETREMNVSNGSEVSVNGREGQAGNLKITGNSLTLNRGFITAETGKSGVEGGANITLQFRDLLKLENESLISATANGDANGGNIDIDPIFVLIFPPMGPNGSDIIVKAVGGTGGKINISAQGLFGIKQRKSSEGNRTNDIDASSEFGASGQVQINGTVDPNQGVAQIPETVVDPNALVSQSPCKRGSQSQFTRTGRGGLPPNLSDDLSGETTQVGLVKPAPSIVAEGQAQKTSSGVAPNENQTSNIENPIVPAQGWSFNDNGEVVLTAYNPAVIGPQRLQENPVGCPAF
jgi:filamentous hemagglutinin family protein